MQAIILAAGEGIRLRPYTNLVPKPLFTIKGKTLLTHHIDKLNSLGIDNKNIFVIVKYLKEEIIGFLERYHPGVNYIVQENKYGTASAVKTASKYITDDYILITYADEYFEDTLEEFKKDELIIGVKEVDDVSKYGKIIEENGYLKEIKEKTETGKGKIFVGVIKVTKDFFKILDKIKPNEKTGEYYLTDAILEYNKIKKFRIYTLKGKRSDIGNEEALINARKM
ncbi:MAG: sugar phosphate nucleotidyltransferase [Nitrososphaerota archaeon]